jgi:hypothetical protein
MLRWSRLLCLPVLPAVCALGLGCRDTPAPVTRPDWPESCGRDSLGAAKPGALVGRPRLLLVGPTGADGQARDCRAGTRELLGRLTAASGTAAAAVYEAEVALPGILPAASTIWAVLPPLIVADGGAVTRHSYQPALDPVHYRSATSGGQVSASKAAAVRLQIEATPDEEPPELITVDAGVPLVSQGDRISIRFRVADGGSGLLTAPIDRPDLLPQVALFSLFSPDTGLTLPLWPLASADVSQEARVPGGTPQGLYLVVGEASDQAGNRIRWASEPGVVPGSARYQAEPAPLCIPPRLPPAPRVLPLQMQVVFVGAAAGADLQAPTLQGLSVEGETRDAPVVAGPCQEVRLRLDVGDDRGLPADQEGWLWVGPLDEASGRASLVQVRAYPTASPGRLETRFVVPAEAAAGPWIFLPAQAADDAGNVLLGSHEPAAGGPGAIRLGDAVSPPGPDPQVPGQQRGERSTIAPGRFCVTSCTPGGGAAGAPAVLEKVEVLDEDTSMPLRGGRTLRLRFSFSRAGGGLPTTIP